MTLQQTNGAGTYAFYVGRAQDKGHAAASLDQQYFVEVWKPTLRRLVPKSPAKAPFFVWSALKFLKLFGSAHYVVFFVKHGGRVVHYSVVLPKYFRTPFMGKNDLQIGPCWTHNEHRRKGIASYVIHEILESYKEADRRFWYIVREDNIPSRRLVEKAGFTLYGKGVREKRFGIRAMGAFSISDKLKCGFPGRDEVMEPRKQIERAYYNTQLRKILDNPEAYDWRWGSQSVPSSLRKGYEYCEDFLAKRCDGKKVLDYGCGTGTHSIHMAKSGALVTGIDISEVAIEVAKIRARREKVDDRCDFIIGDAEKTGFSDNTFDLVFNSGTMSYLDLNVALSEICRVLKPHGTFLGIDTLGHNPIFNLNRYVKYRKGQRTKQTWKGILRMSDLDRFRDYFANTKFRYFDLTTAAGIPFEKFPKIHPPVLKLLESVDNLLLSCFIKRYAFKVVFALSEPIKNSTPVIM